MRGITGTLVILLAAGYLASIVELPKAWSGASPSAIQEPAKKHDPWRRTTAGWERTTRWEMSGGSQKPLAAWRVHPLAIASLQVLISLFALLLTEPTAEVPTVVLRRQVNSQLALCGKTWSTT